MSKYNFFKKINYFCLFLRILGWNAANLYRTYFKNIYILQWSTTTVTFVYITKVWRWRGVIRRFLFPNHFKKKPLQNYLPKLSMAFKTSNKVKTLYKFECYKNILAKVLTSQSYFCLKQWLYLYFGTSRSSLTASVTSYSSNSHSLAVKEAVVSVGSDHVLGS